MNDDNLPTTAKVLANVLKISQDKLFEFGFRICFFFWLFEKCTRTISMLKEEEVIKILFLVYQGRGLG